jgi:hypothetical protein
MPDEHSDWLAELKAHFGKKPKPKTAPKEPPKSPSWGPFAPMLRKAEQAASIAATGEVPEPKPSVPRYKRRNER